MSKEGLQKAAEVFSLMQLTRIDLLRKGGDHQDVLLGQMLETGKEAMKNIFCKLTLMREKMIRKRYIESTQSEFRRALGLDMRKLADDLLKQLQTPFQKEGPKIRKPKRMIQT